MKESYDDGLYPLDYVRMGGTNQMMDGDSSGLCFLNGDSLDLADYDNNFLYKDGSEFSYSD